MKLSIVGGGITGCIAAVHSAREGHEVTLLEASSDLGGVLRDIQVTEGIYFNGCQYLQQGVLDRMGWSDAFSEFSHEYGSITALGNTTTRVVNDCAQPAFDGKVDLCNKSAIHTSALERLESYKSNSPQIIRWAQSFGDLANLDWKCLVSMQLSRLHFPDDEQISRLKIDSQRANELLAVSRRIRGLEAESAWLPNEGYNVLFDRLHHKMSALGVDIQLNSPITPVFELGQFSIRSRSEKIEADLVVWATNPVPLFNRLFSIRMDTPPVKMKLLFGNLLQIRLMPVSLPYYWQVFDIESSVVRIYLYELCGEIRFSAETFDSVDDATAWRDLKHVMKLCGLDCDHYLVGIVKQLRHVNFSTKEFKAFENLEADMLRHRVVPGGWQHFGREEKINSIISLIDYAQDEAIHE